MNDHIGAFYINRIYVWKRVKRWEGQTDRSKVKEWERERKIKRRGKRRRKASKIKKTYEYTMCAFHTIIRLKINKSRSKMKWREKRYKSKKSWIRPNERRWSWRRVGKMFVILFSPSVALDRKVKPIRKSIKFSEISFSSIYNLLNNILHTQSLHN